MRHLFSALLLIASPVFAQQRQSTAYDALRVVGTQVSRALVGRVISVSGADGDPQPVTWRVLVADNTAAGGVREIEVANGRVVAQRSPADAGTGSTRAATINTSRLNLDSSGAFSVASYTADQAHTNFSLVNYTLRNDRRGNPVWIVTLQDEARRPLGTVHIGANKGTVTRVEGMYGGANMAQTEQGQPGVAPQITRRPREQRSEQVASNDDPVYDSDEVASEDEGDDGDVNPVKKQIKRLFHRSKSQAERMFGRVRSSFDDYFYRR